MKKNYFIVIILVFLSPKAFSQTDSLGSLFPLAVGNYWQYKVTNIFFIDTMFVGYDYTEVLKDTIIGNPPKTFYKIKVPFSWSSIDNLIYLRYDSQLKSIIEFKGEERALFKLDAIEDECWDYVTTDICCWIIDTINIFNYNKTYKKFHIWGMPSWDYDLAKDFGTIKLLFDNSFVVTNKTFFDLVYAKINGIEYGTYVTGINDESLKPNGFLLSQNYPNPFNPTTKINYQIPQTDFVTLKVYDILGREETTLVNKEKPAGSYEVEFDGSSLSSGIYFYKLQAGNYISVKKMILLK